jgi:hypothetical protein
VTGPTSHHSLSIVEMGRLVTHRSTPLAGSLRENTFGSISYLRAECVEVAGTGSLGTVTYSAKRAVARHVVDVPQDERSELRILTDQGGETREVGPRCVEQGEDGLREAFSDGAVVAVADALEMGMQRIPRGGDLRDGRVRVRRALRASNGALRSQKDRQDERNACEFR